MGEAGLLDMGKARRLNASKAVSPAWARPELAWARRLDGGTLDTRKTSTRTSASLVSRSPSARVDGRQHWKR